jgi:hypothetical protein
MFLGMGDVILSAPEFNEKLSGYYGFLIKQMSVLRVAMRLIIWRAHIPERNALSGRKSKILTTRGPPRQSVDNRSPETRLIFRDLVPSVEWYANNSASDFIDFVVLSPCEAQIMASEPKFANDATAPTSDPSSSSSTTLKIHADSAPRDAVAHSPATVESPDTRPAMRAALTLLIEARRYAESVRHDLWDFAVETDRLAAVGLTRNDLRWLLCKGYVTHAAEVKGDQQTHRIFRAVGDLALSDDDCFVLTESGSAFEATLFAQQLAPRKEKPIPSISAERRVPTWNRKRGELRLGDIVVKRFKVPAANQELILDSFEELGWPDYIDDPLPPQPEQDSKRRLHAAIDRLNLKQRLIRFHVARSGCGIRWELV